MAGVRIHDARLDGHVGEAAAVTAGRAGGDEGVAAGRPLQLDLAGDRLPSGVAIGWK